jgi:hypothetical protein
MDKRTIGALAAVIIAFDGTLGVARAAQAADVANVDDAPSSRMQKLARSG